MNKTFETAAALFACGCISAPEAFREALVIAWVLDLRYALVDPMTPNYEALGSEEPMSQYADSRESAEAPAIQ